MKLQTRTLDRRHQIRLASYFVVFALLLNITYIPCYFYIRDLNRKNVLSQHSQKLEDGVATLSQAIQQMGFLNTFLSDDEHYATLTRRPHELTYADADALREMTHNYLLPSTFIGDAGLSLGGEVLFTQKRLYYQLEPLALEKYFRCDEMSIEEFTGLFNGPVCVLGEHHFHSQEFQRYQAFTVAWRWSHGKDIYFFVNFPTERLFSLLAHGDVVEQGALELTIGNERIASWRMDERVEQGEGMVSAKLKALNINLSVYVPKKLIDANMERMRMLVNLFVSIMMLATIIWIVACTLGASKPMNRIMKSLDNSKAIQSELNNGQGTIADLARSIDKLDSRIASYQDIIVQQQERLRTQTLEKALYRGLYTREEVSAFCEAYPNFPKRWRLALLQYTSAESAVEEEKISFLLTEYLQSHLSYTILLPTELDAMLMVFSCGENEDPHAALEQLRTGMEKDYGLLIHYVISAVYDDPQNLGAAYQQIEYESGVRNEPGIAANTQQMPLTFQQVQTMYIALSNGNEELAVETLGECAKAIRINPDFTLAKCAWRMIANMLVVVKLESASDLRDAVIPPFQWEEWQQLYEVQLPECFHLICQRITAQRLEASQQLMEQIFAYIQAELSNPMLSLTMVTDRFGISAPTLQKRLRAAIGQTFSAYVESERMRKARRELTETERTVQEISEDCGYATPNSFYKAYKRIFDEAPLDIRKKKHA